jgi:Domain of unknown function (DUF4340)
MKPAISRRKRVYLTLIVLLSVILLLQQLLDGDAVAEIPAIEDEITSIRIEGRTAVITARKTGGQWLLGEENYPADTGRVESLIDRIGNLRILERVSSTDFLSPYKLDAGEAIQVTLYSKGRELRSVLIGRGSPTGRQSYIRFPDSNEVLLVEENLRRDFEVTTGDLREKRILTLDPSLIRRLRVTIPPEISLDLFRDGDSWSSADGRDVDGEKVTAYLRNFEALQASGFPEGVVDSGELLMHLEFETDTGRVYAELLSETAEGEYLARSSQTPYIFSLSSFKGVQLLSGPEEFIRAGDQ